MSMLISIYILVIKTINLSDSAPKLGGLLFEPLLVEARSFQLESKEHFTDGSFNKMYTSKESTSLLYTTESSTKTLHKTEKVTQSSDPSTKKSTKTEINASKIRRQNVEITNKPQCIGYDFDDSLCKTINNRILCGYNKNIGVTPKEPSFIDLGNGCRLRGERIECGYLEPPFSNYRRPPADDLSLKNAILRSAPGSANAKAQANSKLVNNEIETSTTLITIMIATDTTGTIPTSKQIASEKQTFGLELYAKQSESRITSEPLKKLTEADIAPSTVTTCVDG